MNAKENIKSAFNEEMRKIETDCLVNYETSLKEVPIFLLNYSVRDILNSLFTISIWLRNIASPLKLKFVYMVFCSLNENEYTENDLIKDYKDFQVFTSELLKILPKFQMLEDYIPIADWGEIKYCFEKNNYKIFYGGDLDGVYEYIECFNMIHCSIDKTYVTYLNRSPKQELEICLNLQQTIIESIDTNCKREETLDISPGFLDLPSVSFWNNCLNFYNKFDTFNIPLEFMNNYSCKLGDINDEYLEKNNFLNDYHDDRIFRYMFIDIQGKFFPILPRRIIAILIQVWGEFYNINKEMIFDKEPSLNTMWDQSLFHFIKQRLDTKEIFNLVSPFDKVNNSPSDSIYSCSFVCNEEIYLVFLLEPLYSEKEISKKLKEFSKNLEKDIVSLSQDPITLLLRLENKNNVIAIPSIDNSGQKLSLKILLVIPRINISFGNIKIPPKFKGEIILLEDFLGIFDEINSLDEIQAFFKFLDAEKNRKSPFSTALDMYGAFKESHGILNAGAEEPTSIYLDSGWGSNFRFKSLKIFWTQYPEVNFIDPPRSWILYPMKEKLIRMVSKKIFMSVLHVKVGKVNVFINAPFYELSEKQGRVSDLLMQIIQDGFSMYEDILNKHEFFSSFNKLQIFIYPFDITNNNERVNHLKNLNPQDESYKLDWGVSNTNMLSIRISFNFDKVYELFKESKHRKFEIDFILSVINKLNEITYDDTTQEIVDVINMDSTNLPRFKMNVLNKLVSYPDFAKVISSDDSHFKAAKKIIAVIALNNEIVPGEYSVQEAEVILNKLKSELVKVINARVNEYDLNNSIIYLISKADALSNKYELKNLVFHESLKHDVDYSREEKYAKNHMRFAIEHRNYRYLIEKFIQLTPIGKLNLSEDNLKSLLAIVDWLHVIQSGSDSIHYEITQTGIIINEDFQVDVKYSDAFETREKEFGLEEASFDLETIGNTNDRIINKNFTIFLNELDVAFKKDLGFKFKNLITLIDVLKYWPTYCKSVEEKEFYKASSEELYKVISAALSEEEFDKLEFASIIDFLTLSKESILFTTGEINPCDDLPIWEHNKRPMRYNLKPLIKIDNDYYWGPYSVRTTQNIWLGNVSSAISPFEIQTENIPKLMDLERKNISEALNIKAEIIMKKHTVLVKKNCELYRLNKHRGFPADLGDYDVLAYLTDQNIIINIECKDLKPPFCLKDARRTRESIFGKTVNERGYFEKVMKRETYLKENYEKILSFLKWKINNSLPLQVKTFFIMRRNYWWTKFPPFKTDVVFLRIDLLDDFISNLSDKLN